MQHEKWPCVFGHTHPPTHTHTNMKTYTEFCMITGTIEFTSKHFTKFVLEGEKEVKYS